MIYAEIAVKDGHEKQRYNGRHAVENVQVARSAVCGSRSPTTSPPSIAIWRGRRTVFWRWPSHTLGGPGSGHALTGIEGSEVLEGANRLSSMSFTGFIQSLAGIQGPDAESLHAGSSILGDGSHITSEHCFTVEAAVQSGAGRLRSRSRLKHTTMPASG
jgi:hypothetical protein